MAIAVFDLYGTLVDVAGAARIAAQTDARLAEVWPRLATAWRQRQLDYTWLHAAAGRHTPFDRITADSLDVTLAELGLSDADLRDRLLALYRHLPAWPEAPAALAALRARGMRLAVLSNGTPAMIAEAVAGAGIAGAFDALLSVEAAGVYKPAPAVYDLVGAHFGSARGDVLFVSANGWDAAGAAGYGFRAVWVNRTGAPQDRLWAAPAHVVADLSALPALV